MVLKVYFFMQHEYVGSWQHDGPIRPHQKKILSNIVGLCVVGGKTHSSLWLILHKVTYEIIVSVPTENMVDI
jgi:hypothetical protein